MHQAAAENLAGAFSDLRGAMLKFGQVLSFADTHWLPAEYREVYQELLMPLQDSARPISFNMVRKIIEAELRCRIEDAFLEFSRTPFAAASIGQVHMAISPQGKKLAVKVQYPGIDAAIRQDLQNLDLVVRILELLFRARSISPNIDFDAVAEEVHMRVLEELDYKREAALQETFGRLYQGHRSIRIPPVVKTLTTRRVLVSDYVLGHRWVEARRASSRLRNCWGETVFRFAIGSLHQHGLFNGDPHPGNYLFHPDGTVTFLDFGCVRSFSRETTRQLSRLQIAAINGDAKQVHQACSTLGILSAPIPERETRDLLAWMRFNYLPLIGPQPFTYTIEYARELFRRQFDPHSEWAQIRRRISLPQELVYLNRVTIGLNSILGELGASADWYAVATEYWRDKEDAALR
jgi:predicted unusual protein kinase regulating ubiquinone biosynthesis (AarF/ABC1/UbiB family)